MLTTATHFTLAILTMVSGAHSRAAEDRRLRGGAPQAPPLALALAMILALALALTLTLTLTLGLGLAL